MQRETVSYQADGLDMNGELFFLAGSRPQLGVLVFPEAFGLNEHALARAERLASLGYVALACDLHGQARVVPDFAAAIDLPDPLYADPSKTRARADGGLRALVARAEVDATRVAAIGFCFGGTMGLEVARSGAAVRAVVGFHSGLASVVPRAGVGSIKARILVCIGGDDPFITASQRADFESEMRELGAEWQMNVYGGTVHSFTNPAAASVRRPEAVRYSAEADRRSWQAMQNFFAEAFHVA